MTVERHGTYRNPHIETENPNQAINSIMVEEERRHEMETVFNYRVRCNDKDVKGAL